MLNLTNINYSAYSDSIFGKGEYNPILKDVSLQLNEGEIVGIVGESGAGKTTLAKIISGIVKPDSGEIVFEGKTTKDIFDEVKIQILFQNSIELINPFRKVENILNEVVRKYSLTNSKDKIIEMIELVGLRSDILTKVGSNLSGGERQRIGLIRLLAANPTLLIVDEPFSAQDIESQINLLKLLQKLNKDSGLSIVCISHDIQIISKFTDKLFVLKDGQIIEEGITSEILTSPKHSYTKFLLKARDFELTYSNFTNLNKELN